MWSLHTSHSYHCLMLFVRGHSTLFWKCQWMNEYKIIDKVKKTCFHSAANNWRHGWAQCVCTLSSPVLWGSQSILLFCLRKLGWGHKILDDWALRRTGLPTSALKHLWYDLSWDIDLAYMMHFVLCYRQLKIHFFFMSLRYGFWPGHQSVVPSRGRVSRGV